jgi:hypothetical protein
MESIEIEQAAAETILTNVKAENLYTIRQQPEVREWASQR